MKIVYCINSISHIGGIARVTVAKANALAAIEGNEVWLAYTDVDPDHPEPALPLDNRVHTIDLGIRYYADDTKGLYYRLREDSVLRRRHKKVLEKSLNRIEPDIVISVGQSEKYFLPKLRLRKRPAFVREFHYHKRYRHEGVTSMTRRAFAWLNDFYDYRLHLPRYDAIAVLTQEDYERSWSNTAINGKVTVIPNPVTVRTDKVADLTARNIITIGRISYPKNHESLLKAWEIVSERHSDWTLTICGTGDRWEHIQQMIAELRHSNSVITPGNVENVNEYLVNSSIFVLSSRFEGFPLAILEAAGAGIPIVSYACPCGPRDMLTDGKDGFLVPPGDEDILSDRICRLIEDEELRHKMGAAALETSRKYTLERIAAQWMNLFNKLRK